MPSPSENPVDAYMARLAAPLKPLPAAVRDEHLRELRQHVEQLIVARAGQPDAVPLALSQMGDPVQVGQDLVREWQKQKRIFWQTVIAVGTCQMLFSQIISHQASLMFGLFHRVDGTNGRGWTTVYNGLVLLPPVIAGTVIGRRLPEQAIFAAFLAGSLASLCGGIVLFCQSPQLYVFLFGFGVSGNEVFAAYIASSVKRKDWTLRLQ